jgi:hypothetical protein
MRKLILLFLVCWLPSFAAINGSMQWDVRQTGSDSNSGGFDPFVVTPGTDYSQQNSPQITYTDLVVGATTTKYTSVLNVVSSALPGNTLVITGGTGCTTGTYEILSNATITATVDRSLGTAASVCTGVLGGSLLTNSQAFSNATAGNTVNTKVGTYTLTSTLITPSVSYIQWIGYQATHDDGGTKPLVTTATNSTDLVDIAGSLGAIDNISFSNTAGTSANGIVKTSANGTFAIRNCTLAGFTEAVNGDNSGPHYEFTPLIIENTELIGCATVCTQSLDDGGNVYLLSGTSIHGWATRGVNLSAGDLVITGAAIWNNGLGASMSGGNLVVTNSILANNGTVGLNLSQTNTVWSSVNSIYYGNGTYGASNPTGGAYPVAAYTNNAYGSNGTAPTQGLYIPASASANDVALGACNPFVNASTGNFALSSCGKTALAGKGFPGVSPMGTGHLDIGTLQSLGGSTGSAPHAYVQ